MISTGNNSERVLLASVKIRGNSDGWKISDSVEELTDLARSVGAEVVGYITQRLNRPTHTYLGKGKLTELKQMAGRVGCGTVICDDELTPTQQRNLEDALDGIKVIDRTGLILDLFGRRARTKEGRLQVELAQHEYLLPRLAGQWSHLERLGGGIGTRGPGETQIETDRRLVRLRIQRLKKDIGKVRKHRELYRSNRRESKIPVISLVGYTNAGKSTLLNRLTGAKVSAKDQLFSTLDPVTRQLFMPTGYKVLLTDTVGFIHKLPTSLIAAFHATLEEAQEADVLVQVVDITHKNAPEHVEAVDRILKDLSLETKPRLLALNKSDQIDSNGNSDGERNFEGLTINQPRVLFISALQGTGLTPLIEAIDQILADI